MQILASKFIYPADVVNMEATLSPFRNMMIQLSFFQKNDFLQMDHRKIKKISDSFNMVIPTVHAPTVDIFNHEFFDIIKMIKDFYKVSLITIHPQKGDDVIALAKFGEYASVIDNLGVTLAYENFPSRIGRRKWIHLAQEMYVKFDLSFLKITFDTSHLDDPKSCVDEFEAVADKVAVIHLSDQDGENQHQPLGTGKVPYKQFMRHLEEVGFSGPIVIEYMPEYESKLVSDVNGFLL